MARRMLLKGFVKSVITWARRLANTTRGQIVRLAGETRAYRVLRTRFTLARRYCTLLQDVVTGRLRSVSHAVNKMAFVKHGRRPALLTRAA